MQPGTRELGRSVITQIVGLPRSERIRALQEFFPNDELSQNEILSMLDLYDALGVFPDGGAFGGTTRQSEGDKPDIVVLGNFDNGSRTARIDRDAVARPRKSRSRFEATFDSPPHLSHQRRLPLTAVLPFEWP